MTLWNPECEGPGSVDRPLNKEEWKPVDCESLTGRRRPLGATDDTHQDSVHWTAKLPAQLYASARSLHDAGELLICLRAPRGPGLNAPQFSWSDNRYCPTATTESHYIPLTAILMTTEESTLNTRGLPVIYATWLVPVPANVGTNLVGLS